MFVDVIVVHVVQMPIMQVVDMSRVANRGVSAVCTVMMGMIGVMR
jgi:hypothetical protein